MRVYILPLIIGLLAYFYAIMPIRNYLCEEYNMKAVWYLQGCVLKEGEK